MSAPNGFAVSDNVAALDAEWRSCMGKSHAIRELARARAEGGGDPGNIFPMVRPGDKSAGADWMELEEVATDWTCAVGPIVKKLLASPADSWGDLLAQLDGLIEWSIDAHTEDPCERFIIDLPDQIRRLLEVE